MHDSLTVLVAYPNQCWLATTGIGIDKEKIGRLFQSFTQLEAEGGNPYTRQRSGAGLGLSISRRLARMMAGDITVESLPRHGSAFTLWLPSQNAVPGAGTPVMSFDSRTSAIALPN